MKPYRTLLFCLASTAALAFGACWYLAGHGPGLLPGPDHLAPPLDDAAIYFQYARQALQGEWLHYSPGSGLSTGATSLAYGLLLTALMGLGLQGPTAAWLIGTASLLLALVSLDRLGRRLFPTLPAWWHGTLLLSQGAWAAAAFNGLETGLFLALSVAALEALSRPSNGRALLWLAALAWARPEGQWLGAAFGLAWAAMSARPLGRAAWVLVAAASPTLLLWAVSGSPVPDSVRPKAAVLHAGQGFLAHAAEASDYAMAVIKGAWMGFWGGADPVGQAGDSLARNPIGPHAPPLALLGALAGYFYLAQTRRALGAGLLAGLAGLLALLAWQLPVGWHSHRYLSAALPLLTVGMLAGLQSLREQGGTGRSWSVALFLLWTAFGAASWPWHLQRTLDGARDYARSNRNAALLLGQLGPGPVAGVDAGILAYYGGRPFVDLLGITDHAMAMAHSNGKGATLETLLAKGPDKPVWCVLHAQRPDFDAGPWRTLGLLKPVDASWAPGMTLDRWDLSGGERAAKPALHQVPVLRSLNLAQLEDERAWRLSVEGPSAHGTRMARMRVVRGGSTAPEGGRLLWSAAFDVEPGAAGLLLRASLEAAGRLLLLQGGKSVVKHVGPSPADAYGEYWVPLPQERGGRVTMVLLDEGQQPQEWALYRLWTLAPEALALLK